MDYETAANTGLLDIIFNWVTFALFAFILGGAIWGYEKIRFALKYPDWPLQSPSPLDMTMMKRNELVELLNRYDIDTNGLPKYTVANNEAIDLIYKHRHTISGKQRPQV